MLLKNKLYYYILIIFILLSIIYKYYNKAFIINGSQLEIDKNEAIDIAYNFLKDNNIDIKNKKVTSYINIENDNLYYVQEKLGIEKTKYIIDNNIYNFIYWNIFLIENKNIESIKLDTKGNIIGFYTNIKIKDDKNIQKEIEKVISELLNNNIDIKSKYKFINSIKYKNKNKEIFLYKYINNSNLDIIMSIVYENNYIKEINQYIDIKPEEYKNIYKIKENNKNFYNSINYIIATIYVIIFSIIFLYIYKNNYIEYKKVLVTSFIIITLQIIDKISNFYKIYKNINNKILEKNIILKEILIIVKNNLYIFVIYTIIISIFFYLYKQNYINNYNKSKNKIIKSYIYALINAIYIIFFYIYTNYKLKWFIPSNNINNIYILDSNFLLITIIVKIIIKSIKEELILRFFPALLIDKILSKIKINKINTFILIILSTIISIGENIKYIAIPIYAKILEYIPLNITLSIIFNKYGLIYSIYTKIFFKLIIYTTGLLISKAEYKIEKSTLVIILIAPIIIKLIDELITQKNN